MQCSIDANLEIQQKLSTTLNFRTWVLFLFIFLLCLTVHVNQKAHVYYLLFEIITEIFTAVKLNETTLFSFKK